MDTAQVVLFGGGLLSIMFGLLGIAITQRDNTDIVDILNQDEQKSYWIQRLVTEGIALCECASKNSDLALVQILPCVRCAYLPCGH